MVGLSEKAKGKQRAIEPLDPAEQEEPAKPTQRPVTIRFTEGLPDLTLTLGIQDSVRTLKRKIRENRPQTVKRRLRLIYSGRILTNEILLLEWLDSLERRQKRQVDAQEGKGKAKVKDDSDNFVGGSETKALGELGPTWLHCSVGAEVAEVEDEDEEHVQKSQIKPLRGFDRLAAAGFSEEDIANFRRTFHSQSAANYLDAEPLGDDEDYEEHARALEERWIESLDSGADSPISPSSASRTLLQGLLVGFFFPLLPFFFFHEARPAVFWENGRSQDAPSSVVFSKRMQMALVLGFILNITFGAWRYVLGR
ncbi:uncharacterized protein FOMMEDRAFT_142985 [Fomitiporia mediterranea MF3/22]|uniref:uncharacterized protein n=1 Tax=Fomitiporia mediterranea (strain MF3/22) TaxID=694068 RepID=UPI0004408430|nr:uncharacterized protein FOMMEDRAFT_142985 [Fomitiporia mediterranea MF3/22]EJC98967.1 hypothetical protein FOMMEDRAFT_142985 [Fomitiporia mediterranea MF3/22]